jgi:hypothetical protein
MHRIEGSISDLVKTLALPRKKMNRTLTLCVACCLCYTAEETW